MFKTILKIFGIIIVGAIGALLFEVFALPFLLNCDCLNNIVYLKNLKREIITNPVQQVFIEEGDTLKIVADKVKDSVVAVGEPSESLACGFILTSDGSLITKASVVPINKVNFEANVDGTQNNVKILKRDEKNGLAILKIEGKIWPSLSFVEAEKVGVGSRVFMVAVDSKTGKQFVIEGIIKAVGDGYWEASWPVNKALDFCPVFNLKAEFVGLSQTIQQKAGIMTADQVRLFAGF